MSDDLVQAAVAAALREAAKEAKTYFIGAGGEDIAGREVRAGAEISRAILDLIPEDAQAALDRVVAAEVKPYRIALADAIRRPMGVIPASAEGLVTTYELDAAEQRRYAIREGGE